MGNDTPAVKMFATCHQPGTSMFMPLATQNDAESPVDLESNRPV